MKYSSNRYRQLLKNYCLFLFTWVVMCPILIVNYIATKIIVSKTLSLQAAFYYSINIFVPLSNKNLNSLRIFVSY